jgi:hypothetical protein
MKRFRHNRRGLTLTELIIAGAIMAMLTIGMGSLVMTVHATNAYCRGQGIAAQHARVTLDRIDRAVRQARANREFPGCLVVADSIGGFDLPDTLVVWSPSGPPADPHGLPRVNELALYCPDPALPSKLVEIRSPGNANVCPPPSDEAAWATLVSTIQTSAQSVKVELTNRLRGATVSGNEARGCVRFEVLMSPSANDWAQYRAATLAWKDMDWPLDYYSTQTGIRRVVCQTELQIVPGDESDGPAAVPFFGSATLTYELTK